jgi:hypothetical protein
MDTRGRGINARGACRLSFNARTGVWIVNVRQSRGNWQIPWAAAGLRNTDVLRPGAPVTITAVVLVGNEGFVADAPLTYTARANKSGVAR